MLILEYGCTQPKYDMDGLWVSAYQIQTIPNQGIADYNKIMRIVGDSIFFRTTGDPKNGSDAKYFKTKFKRTSDRIVTEDENFNRIYIHEISHDSIIISYDTENSTKEVFKKQKQLKSEINWNPSNKSYEWQGNRSLVNTEFLENGLFIDYLHETEEVSVGHWNTFNIKNNLFLVFDKLNITALSVDSLVNNKVHLSIQDKQKFNYTLKERNHETPKNLLGDWVLKICDTLRIEQMRLPKGYQRPTLDFLQISKDSILIKRGNIESIKKWILGGTSNLMIIPDVAWPKDQVRRDTLTIKEKTTLINLFKIDSLSKNELVLLAEYVNGFELKLTYHRKN
ncbi:hypothetical protein QSV08_03105 [Maribacter sp. BPC-D8]|uniref:hypothetical protein n=1 Tax=Maribacter sp. BPC-D8 TaxID=3053613 RepID=UPI002B4A3481|nr:hypothetical protein [Maribacter sp. BPC-D8]WRI30232.1 hypothetical protein QSV08_03105 [Maribacter sp. BPC-D8]